MAPSPLFCDGLQTGAFGNPTAVGLHGLLGGGVSVAQGGKFGSGFAAGAFGKLATVGLQSANMSLYQTTAGGGFADTSLSAIASRTAIAAIMGGTASELSGGTFANGARTAAMQHLFNAERDNLEVFKDAARNAISTVDSTIGPVLKRIPVFGPMLRGTFIHAQFAANIRMLGDPMYNAEVSYIDGWLVDYSTKGSIRADATYGDPGGPAFAIELKTGGASITPQEVRQYSNHLPKGTELFQLREVDL